MNELRLSAVAVAVVVVLVTSCSGGSTAAPPPTPPADPVVQSVDAAPVADIPPPIDPKAIIWGERIEKAFVALTAKSLVPAPPLGAAVAAWSTLGLSPIDLPTDDDALADALRTRVTEQVSRGNLEPARVWAAIAAIADAADNGHAAYLDAARVPQLEDSVGGKPFVMPGAVVHQTPDNEVVVAEITPGTPAATAGLAVGDVIASIDGYPLRRVAPLWPLIFQPAGTTTKLHIQRGTTELDLTLVLQPFLHPIASHRILKGNIGYIRTYFCGAGESADRNLAGLIRIALADFDKKKATRLVLDFRGNLGGMGVTSVASIFTPADPILFSRALGDTEDYPWPRKGDVWPRKRPIAVLVDEQTISCGEMIPFALQEHGVARLFGQPTGDALTVPETIDLGDGHVLWVPFGAVFGPKTKVPPEGYRVTPDELVPNRTVAELMAGADPQMDAAVKWLGKQPMPKR